MTDSELQRLAREIQQILVTLSRIEAMLGERCPANRAQIDRNTVDLDQAFSILRKHEKLAHRWLGVIAGLSIFGVPFFNWLLSLWTNGTAK